MGSDLGLCLVSVYRFKCESEIHPPIKKETIWLNVTGTHEKTSDALGLVPSDG